MCNKKYRYTIMNWYKIKYITVWRCFITALSLCFFNAVIDCELMARDTDSMAVFDQAVSYQSELSNQEQIVITKEAEKYAKLKGNVYKALSYACTRGKLYFLSDYGDSCEQLYNRIIPEVEYELDMDSREYARKGHLKKKTVGWRIWKRLCDNGRFFWWIVTATRH